MMSWHGESHLTIFWNVKVSSLMDLLLSLLSKAPLSPLFTLANSLLLGPAHHLELPSGFFRSIEDIFFLQVHQIHLEIDLRWMTLAEIRRQIGAASVDWVIPACSYSFIKPALADGFSSDHILGPLFEKDLKGQMGYFSLSFLSLLC